MQFSLNLCISKIKCGTVSNDFDSFSVIYRRLKLLNVDFHILLISIFFFDGARRLENLIHGFSEVIPYRNLKKFLGFTVFFFLVLVSDFTTVCGLCYITW